MRDNNETTRLELAAAEENSKYLVRSKPEIAFILRAIMQRGELVTAFFGEGSDFILTSILQVNPQEDAVVLDYGADETHNQAALKNGKIVFVTFQDKVRVQFTARAIAAVSFEGRPAFRVPMPESLLRLQRREYYRLTTPVANPIKCLIPLGPKGAVAEETVLDISCGGLSFITHRPELSLELGTVYEGCRLDLPTEKVVVTLKIRNTFDITLRSGVRCKRSGCEFVDLPARTQIKIQRYIVALERERNSKLTGMG